MLKTFSLSMTITIPAQLLFLVIQYFQEYFQFGFKEENCRAVRAKTRQFVCHFGGCYA